jgi:hypothetical protein
MGIGRSHPFDRSLRTCTAYLFLIRRANSLHRSILVLISVPFADRRLVWVRIITGLLAHSRSAASARLRAMIIAAHVTSGHKNDREKADEGQIVAMHHD